MKTSFKSLLLAGAISMTAALPANSRNLVEVGEVKGWTISANISGKRCLVTKVFENNADISFVYDGEAVHMAFGNPSSYLNEGEGYFINAFASNGASGRLNGTAISRNRILIDSLTWETVYNIAKTRSLTIQGLGRYSMYGSHDALKRLSECYMAIK